MDDLTRANSVCLNAVPDANGIPLSRDSYEAVLQRAKRDRAVFLRSMVMRLFGRP
jgi:hypothetical protein